MKHKICEWYEWDVTSCHSNTHTNDWQIYHAHFKSILPLNFASDRGWNYLSKISVRCISATDASVRLCFDAWFLIWFSNLWHNVNIMHDSVCFTQLFASNDVQAARSTIRAFFNYFHYLFIILLREQLSMGKTGIRYGTNIVIFIHCYALLRRQVKLKKVNNANSKTKSEVKTTAREATDISYNTWIDLLTFVQSMSLLTFLCIPQYAPRNSQPRSITVHRTWMSYRWSKLLNRFQADAIQYFAYIETQILSKLFKNLSN